MVVESLVSDEDPFFTNCYIFKRRLLVNFDCTAMWVKRSEFLVDALSVTPEILRSKEYSSNQVSDFRDWQVRPRAGGRVTVFRLCFRGALSFGHGLPGAVHDAQEKNKNCKQVERRRDIEREMESKQSKRARVVFVRVMAHGVRFFVCA